MSIHIRSLTKRFGQQVIFDRYNVDIPSGKVTMIIGSSGCGKTTLLRIIAGLDTRYQGEVVGVPERVSYMFQEDRLLPWFTVRQNIEFVLKDVMSTAQMSRAVKSAVEAVSLSGHEDKYPAKLSGGMKRRVAMARAFAYPSDLLLMDEPFKGLDTKLKQEMMSLFERLYVDQNKTAILVSHDEAVINSFNCNVINLG